TKAQWKRLAGDDPSWYQSGKSYWGDPPIGPTHPIEQVSWQRCRDLLELYGLALPTEAQWEYGCRAGTTARWCTGDTVETLDHFANVMDRTVRTQPRWTGEFAPFEDRFAGPSPVGTFRANAFGLFDVHGNVWEWCLDGYAGYEHELTPGTG